MFIQPVTGYRKVVTPAFRSQAENPLLKQSDITRLDSKLVIGRAPGACRYENHQYKINSNILDKDLQFLKSNYNVDTLIDLRAGHIEGNEITKEANAAKKAGMTYLNLQMDGAIAPKPDELKSFFNTIDKAKGNVYLHCHMGHDRTGVMSACYMAKVHKLNEEFAFQKVFDERGVTRLKYMYGHPDHLLVNAVSTHGTPFVMITAQPQFCYALEFVVVSDHFRNQMAMIVNNWHFCRMIMK